MKVILPPLLPQKIRQTEKIETVQVGFPQKGVDIFYVRNLEGGSFFKHLHVVRGETVAFAGQVNEIGSRTGGVVYLEGCGQPKEKVAHLIFGGEFLGVVDGFTQFFCYFQAESWGR